MVVNPRYASINYLLNKRCSLKRTLIVQHRGAHTGNIVQNTLPAFKTSFMLGADIVELDVSMSTDKKLYCFHDSTEPMNLGMKRNIKTLDSRIITEFELLNSIDEPSGFKVELFEDVLKEFDKGELINIDRSWEVLDELFDLLNKYPDSINQAIIKIPAKEEYLEKFEKEKSKFMVMVIIKSITDLDIIFKYKNINLVGLECIIRTSKDEFFKDKFIEEMHEKNLFLYINAITLSAKEKHILSAGFDDNKSLLEGFDKGWGVLIDKKFDIIQTDWPELLNKYIERRFYQKK